MLGTQDNEGVSIRALRTLLESRGAAARCTELHLSVLEIHRESIHDLLSPPLPKGEKLDVRATTSFSHRKNVTVCAGAVGG